MKKALPSPRIIAAIIAAVLSTQTIHAATDTWNATGGNWSLGANWSTLAAPGTADDAVFSNVGAGTASIMDANRTINSLNYSQDNQSTHTTTISPGQTLTINRTTAGNVLYVGSTSASTTASTLTPVVIQGAGGTLSLSGTGDLVVRQGFSTANGSHLATLDASGLDTINATLGRLLVGQAITGDTVNRPSGTFLMAKTNHFTLTGTAPQVMVQDAGVNSNTGAPSLLSLGQLTTIFADSMRLGGQKGSGTVNFNAAFATPKLQLRNADGVSRVSSINVGDNSFVSSGNNTVASVDLSLGSVDALVGTVVVARGNPGPLLGTCAGTLTMGAGTFDVNTLEVGYQVAAGASGAVTGTVNVNNNLQSTGAVLVVNTSMRLARTNTSTVAVNGTLSVNGGTVVASSIVAGGGNSTITLTSGSTLVVSNSAGTLAAPIRNFNISDATLRIPALNSGAVIAVSNLTAGGSQNVVNISAVPPISSYPATFNLITYQTGVSGNFVLGTLPAASPSYSGTILDTGNGVVALRLTAGPVVDLLLRWTGATDGNWDATTLNWLYQGNSSNFFAGAATSFDDNTTQSNINLTTALSPGTVTVSNNVLQYAFSGSGNIAGASSLTKKGTSSLTIANTGVDNFASVTISSGLLQLGAGGPDGSISTLSITNNGTLVVNRSGSLTLSSAISGTGKLTNSGSGLLILSGANTYSGATVVSAGSLQVDQSTSGSGPLTTAVGTLLSGGGTVNGLVTVGGEINPGAPSVPGVFKAHGGLTLSTGSTLTFDLSATDPSSAGSDSIDVVGNINANNNTIRVNFSGTPQAGVDYLLITYSGSLVSSFNPVITGTHFPVSLDTSVAGQVTMHVTGSTGSALKWNSLSDSTWDTTAINWLDQGNSTPSAFFSGDSVLLDDTANVVPTITIGAGVSVTPSVITNDSANNSFVINGAGRISGTTSIVKTNSSLLAIGTANNFSGTVDVQAGTLRTDNDTALGTIVGNTTVEAGATLDINGHNLGGEPIIVSGAGVGGGAIINSGAAQAQAFRQVTLAGDTTFGGTGLWGINNGGGAASLSTGGNPYKLTKVGVNQVTLAQIAAIDAALGDIDIQQGILEFSGVTASMGDPAHTNTVEAGATLSLANTTVAWNKQFVFNGNGVANTVNIGASGNTELAGPVVMHGDCVYNVGGTLLTISSVISGDGGLIKTGNSPMVLTNINTYTGDTHINAAALRLNGSGSIANSTNIVIAAGATLSVTGRVDATFTLVNNQVLKGNGVVNGTLVAGAGSTVAPGLDAVGSLTVSNAVTLSGTNIMELDEANNTNDVLRCNGSITYGGTLNLVNLGGPITAGKTFKLFYGASYPGSFSSIVPATPGAGQTWDISALGTTGTIKVVAVPTPPHFSGSTLSGTNLVLSGTNGVALSSYYVLASTNVALPLASWTTIATNSFDASGNFSFTNGVNPALPKQFFIIRLP
ncbi:MAG: Alpha-galactosidase [Pedosphaera sp.]|nr:Alpha-galactosidase [Pedosphaera sp.]